MKCQKIVIDAEMDEKHQKCPQYGGVTQMTPRFFRKLGFVAFAPLWYPNFMQNKTSIQWTPDVKFISPTLRKILVKNDFLNKKIKKIS